MLETELLVTSCRMGHLSSNRKVAPLLFGRTNCNLFSFKSDFYSSELHAFIEPFFTEAWANFAFKAIPNLSSVRFASIISNWITKMFSWPELERKLREHARTLMTSGHLSNNCDREQEHFKRAFNLSCPAAHSPFIANLWCKRVLMTNERGERLVSTQGGKNLGHDSRYTYLKQFLRLQITTLRHRFQSIGLTSPPSCSQLRRGYSFAHHNTRPNNMGAVHHTP